MMISIPRSQGMQILFPLILSLVSFHTPPTPAKAGAVLRSPATSQPTDIEVLFSPRGGCTERIVQEIGQATTKIRVQAYSFTSAPIAKVILDAQKRGVDCEVILDKSQAKQTYSEATFFFNQGIPIFIDPAQEEAFEEATEVSILKALHGEISARLPVDPLEKLQQQLQKAVDEERYEDALVLREKIDAILEQRTAAPVRRRKK